MPSGDGYEVGLDDQAIRLEVQTREPGTVRFSFGKAVANARFAFADGVRALGW